MTNEELLEEFVHKAKGFHEDIRLAEDSNRLQFVGEHQAAHKVWLQAIGLLVKCYDCKSGVSGNCDLTSSKQTVYFATFLQGVQATMCMIIEGHYAKSAALLKQDMEILARLGEIVSGQDIEGKTPQVGKLSEGLRMLYGAVNKLAHPSHIYLLEEHLQNLTLDSGSDIGLSPIPIFCSETAIGLCELHVHITFKITREFLIMSARVHGAADKELNELISEANILVGRIREVFDSGERPS